MQSLVEAALLDQERRILAATPEEINARRFRVCRNRERRLRTSNQSGFCFVNPDCRRLSKAWHRQERKAKRG